MQRSRKALLNRRALGISGRSRLYKVSLSLVFVLWGLVFLFSLWFSRGHGYKDGSTVSPVGISTWDEAKLDRDEQYDIQKETDLGYSSGGECTNGVETGGLNGEFFAMEGSKQHASTEGSRQQDLAEGSLHHASTEGSIFHDSAVDEQPEVVTAGSGVKLENDAPKNGRLPRAVPLGLDEFKSKTCSSKSKSGNGQAGGIKHRVEPGGAEYNYASAAKGAKVLAFNKEAKGASNILGKDKDKYLRNPCSAEGKFVDIELSEETLVDTIEIANLEHYSSNLKDFEVLGSLTYPTNEWVFLGNVTAANNKLVQRFVLQQPKWVRYIKLKLLSHYGSEFYCTLSIIELYGVDAVERMLEDLISVEGSSFVSEGATVDQKPVPSHPDSPEVDEFFHDIVKESEPQYAAGVSNVNNDMLNSEVPDAVKEVHHQQVNRMPGDTVLKILMQKVRSLDFSLSVLERYLEESTSKYGSIFGEFDKDLGEKDTDLQKIREDIRNLVQSQEVIAKDVHNLISWQSLVTMQLNNLVRDNAILRSEVEKVREKQISVDNKVLVCSLGVTSSPSWSWKFGNVLETEDYSSSSSAFSATATPPRPPQVLEAAKQGHNITSSSKANETVVPRQNIGEKQGMVWINGTESDEINGTSAIITSTPIKRYSRLEKLEANLAGVRASIREAARVRNLTSTHEDPDYVPRGPIYRNANAFHRSYLKMEKHFKIYVYEEGEPPIFHNGPCKSIYSTEGRFIHEMEMENIYRTRDPDQALVYFLPFSVVMLVQYLYVADSHDTQPIGRAVVDYVNVISDKHPFWNRSLGADHFMLSCHDWGPSTSAYVPHLYQNSIRVLCNANTSEGFNPSKDVSFPEIHLRTGETKGLLGGLSPSRRSILAFFAGRLHGHIRYLLLNEWKEKDQDVQVYDQLPNGVSYESMLKKSRFCLCPSGYEVASPRVVEAIYAECVPVLVSDSYVPPFSDVLEWKSFSVQVQVKDIPNIKRILMGISQSQYLRMQRRVKQVQRHFVVNGPSKRFDVFHMIVHSIWLRRLNIRIEDERVE
ncbi:hypothetical protein C1H46_024731 [Malus baccata]|uniref:SUN domain-containing protein n=1 Tax=Malus baccata TaxID=106549 RepID=A0A540LTE3_MALBA|nr:hypothetical protein C1H46_024731 [Malus baccata]